MIPLFLLHSAVALAWYVLVGWLCLVTYRRLRLKSLPWIAGTYAASLVAAPVTDFLVHRAFPFGADARSIVFTSAGILVLGVSALQYFSKLLLAVLAFSEVAFLLSRAYPDFDSPLLRSLLRAHGQVRIIGIASLLTVAIAPMIVLGYLYFSGPVVPQ